MDESLFSATTSETKPPETITPPKRGPGRPRKILNDPKLEAKENLEKVELENKPKRGRPPGKRTPTFSLEPQHLMALHAVLATAMKAPEIMISEHEAQTLCAASNAMAQEYGLTLDGKTAVTIQFALVSLGIYAPKLMDYSHRLKQQAKYGSKLESDRNNGTNGNGKNDVSVPSFADTKSTRVAN